MKNYTTVSIPRTLADMIEVRIRGTGFKSKSAYVTYILGEIEKEIEKLENASRDESVDEKEKE